MDFVNVKIKEVNGTPAAGAVILRGKDIPGYAPDRPEERLVPGQVVRVPVRVADAYPNALEITRARVTRPVFFLSELHMVAWLKQNLADRFGISAKQIDELNRETYNDLVELGHKEMRENGSYPEEPLPSGGADDEPKVRTRRRSA